MLFLGSLFCPMFFHHIHVSLFFVHSNAVLTPQVTAHYLLVLHRGVKPLLILKVFLGVFTTFSCCPQVHLSTSIMLYVRVEFWQLYEHFAGILTNK